ncbi:hypothetical protein ACJQWK_00393 [Exserohilum turcicum]|uniref:Secreted protein n=1 Tax=Exserohilum turcicum (strain 28A) TaxID=671987 RepID=R0IEE1_EXST2|nr:uncharacterized protein SETTUDRAFT_95212 [Exserohilum turcica Et28A]EOA83645.1 hypothetical protein SETTUDRAFT_95212 [Exserohilum turcica Et28A]
MHTSNNVFALVALPLLTQAAAAPPTPPTITRLVFSGTGCPNDSNSVKPDSSILADAASVTYSQLKGSSTDNCGVHIQSSGASPGWQVAVRQAEYVGDVVLKGNSGLDTYTQVFWSENAGDTSVLTGGLTSAGSDVRDSVTVRSNNAAELSWSRCTGADGNPGILNVNFRPVVQGDYGTYDFKRASWKLEWRKC